MRHLLSPPTSTRFAAERQDWLAQADLLSQSAEKHELQAIALSRCVDPVLASKGREHAKIAKHKREMARHAIARASDLTDYTHPLDHDSDGWALLCALREEAESRALSPAQLRSAILNPRTTALLDYRHVR